MSAVLHQYIIHGLQICILSWHPTPYLSAYLLCAIGDADGKGAGRDYISLGEEYTVLTPEMQSVTVNGANGR